MARKTIPDDVQQRILTKSRRRCCLCFWLTGRDEVQKGQIAHLDQKSDNPTEGNLAFLCFDHHDEYDGVPRLSKGLRESEVRHWRDELYREMEHRFRSFKKRGFELRVTGCRYETDAFSCMFSLKNTGEVVARSPTVTIRLPDNIKGTQPERFYNAGLGMQMKEIDPWAPYESVQDVFESQGRVMIWRLGGMNPILMPDHAVTFNGLTMSLDDYPLGASFELEYRVDAEECPPMRESLVGKVPDDIHEFEGLA